MKPADKLLLFLGVASMAGVFLLWPRPPVPVHPPVSTRPPSVRHSVRAPAAPETAPEAVSVENSTPTDPATAQPKFASMMGKDRTVILGRISNQDLPDILQAALDADRVEHDALKFTVIIQTVLPNAMKQRPPSPEFLGRLRDYIKDPANSKINRGMMIGALGEVQSLATVPILKDLYATSADPVLRAEAASGIAMLGAPNGQGPQEANESSAKSMEQIWLSPASNNDPVMLRSVANGIALLGASSGIEMLLQAALAPNGKDDARKAAALLALRGADILNSHAVPPLAARLSRDNPLTDEASKLASATLVRMQSKAADQALAAWLQNSTSASAPLANAIAAHSQNQAVWVNASAPNVPFRSEQNREAIRAGIAAYRAGRAFQP